MPLYFISDRAQSARPLGPAHASRFVRDQADATASRLFIPIMRTLDAHLMRLSEAPRVISRG
ncbi:MAG: hypothetical protein JO000_00200 [Alphaproteobacteria bacterium]|nr:hypothetical protein [Alphaproteobacteria bacterium]